MAEQLMKKCEKTYDELYMILKKSSLQWKKQNDQLKRLEKTYGIVPRWFQTITQRKRKKVVQKKKRKRNLKRKICQPKV